MDNSDDDEEEMAMLSRKFRKFLKQGKSIKKNKDTNDNPICFKCNKPGHVKKDCLLLKYKGIFKNFNKFNKRKKDYQATLEYSDSCLLYTSPSPRDS